MDNNSSVIVLWVGSTVRYLLATLFGAPLFKSIYDQTLIDRIVHDGAIVLTQVIVGVVIPLGWSYWQKIIAKVREKKALDVNPTADNAEATITRKTRETPLPQKLEIAFGGEK